MNRTIRGMSLAFGLVLLNVMAANVMADQHGTKGAKQEMLAEMWIMTPKEGKMQELEAAIREHAKFRRSKQDPREWRFYSPVLGHNLDRIGVRSWGFTWKDMDSYRDWAEKNGIIQHWRETAGQYVDHTHHYLSVADQENSKWGPDVKYRYVGVTSYVPKLGHRGAIENDKKALVEAAKAQNWPYNWSFADQVGGRGEMVLAIPYENWAAMAPPETEFMEMLVTHMGDESKAQELMKSWTSHFEETDYNIWALRKDMME